MRRGKIEKSVRCYFNGGKMFNITYEAETEIEILEGNLLKVYNVLIEPHVIDLRFMSAGLRALAYIFLNTFYVRIYGEADDFKMQFGFSESQKEIFGNDFFKMASTKIINSLIEYNKLGV